MNNRVKNTRPFSAIAGLFQRIRACFGNRIIVEVKLNVESDQQNEQELEVNVEIKMTKEGLIDAIAASAKLTKADAG